MGDIVGKADTVNLFHEDKTRWASNLVEVKSTSLEKEEHLKPIMTCLAGYNRIQARNIVA